MTTLRAFIVEDNPVILSNLVDALEELTDIKVVGSQSNERDAVRELAERAAELDLIIVDIFLASGSGLGVLQSAQTLQLAAERIVLTNYATADIRRRCKALGAAQVFDKSSELDALIEHCKKLSAA